MFSRKIAASALAVAGLSILGGAANAQFTALPAGTSNPGVAVNDLGVFAPGAFVQSNVTAFTFSATTGASITGNLYQAVFSNGSGLDFAYQLELTAGSPAGQTLNGFTVSSFTGFTTSVAETTSDIDAGVGAAFFSSSSNTFVNATRPGGGSAISGFLDVEVPVGQRSSIFLVRTNGAIVSPTGSAGIFGNGVTANTAATVLAPASVIVNAPEPGSIALLGVGFAGMVGMVARRRKAA